MNKQELLKYLEGFVIYNTERGTIGNDMYAIFQELEEVYGYNQDNSDDEVAAILRTIKGIMDGDAIREAEVWYKQATDKKQTAWWIEIMRHEGAKL